MTPDLPACSDREAFEAWANERHLVLLKTFDGVGNDYQSCITREALAAWTAALAHARQEQAAEIARLREALRKARPYVVALLEDTKAGIIIRDYPNEIDDPRYEMRKKDQEVLDSIDAALTPTATPPGEARDE